MRGFLTSTKNGRTVKLKDPWKYATYIGRGKWRFFKPSIDPSVKRSVTTALLEEIGIQLLKLSDVFCYIDSPCRTDPRLVVYNDDSKILSISVSDCIFVYSRGIDFQFGLGDPNSIDNVVKYAVELVDNFSGR